MQWLRKHKARCLSAFAIAGLNLLIGLGGGALSVRAAPDVQLSVHVHIKMPPNPVTGFVASPVGIQNGDIQLAWIAPSNNNRVSINHYLIRFATYPATSQALAENWWAATASSERLESPAHSPGVQEFTILGGFTIGTTYYFGIKSVDADGMISPIDSAAGLPSQAHSLPLNVAVPPPTPLNFAGVALSSTSVQWTWDTSVGAFFYNLYASPAGTFISQTTETFIVEGSLTPNNFVSRILRAGNGSGLSSPTPVRTVCTLAAIPENLRFITIGSNEITLNWDSGGNPAGTRYCLERSNDGAIYSTVTIITQGSYQNLGLTDLTTYFYRVNALNAIGIPSTYSNVVSTVTPLKVDSMAPQEPMGLSAVLDPTGRAFTLIWESVTRNADATPTNDVAGYNIYRRTALTGPATKLNLTPIQVTAYADRVDNQIFYYTVRAIDSSGNESVDSLFADSSQDANIIFLSTDQITSVVMPYTVSDLLRSGNNKYKSALSIAMTENPIPPNTNIIRNISLNLIRGDTERPVYDLAFSLPETIIAVGYNLVNGQVALGSPAQSQAAVTNATPKDLSFYWNNGVTWVKVGGTLDEARKVLRIKTSYLGDYQLRISPSATSLTLDKANVYPRVFTPNGDGHNDRCFFILENPNNSGVSGEIFDLEGRRVKTLPPPSLNQGIGTTLIWDGTDNNNSVVPSGAYIYRINGEGKTFTGTVAVAR